MALSDYPFPGSLPDFPSRAQVLQYLNDYVDHFGFRERIQLNTEIEQVIPDKESKWNVTIHSADGGRWVERFERGCLMVSTGSPRSRIIRR
jgi:cation diffusion facilitator CzcD-associated flavoprotein CzcO